MKMQAVSKAVLREMAPGLREFTHRAVDLLFVVAGAGPGDSRSSSKKTSARTITYCGPRDDTSELTSVGVIFHA